MNIVLWDTFSEVADRNDKDYKEIIEEICFVLKHLRNIHVEKSPLERIGKTIKWSNHCNR